MSIHAVVRELNDGLGPTLVAALSGSKDRKLPNKWAKDDGPEPTQQFQYRLLAAHRFWKQLEEKEGQHVARQWFIGGNPALGEATPLTFIREDHTDKVAVAVEVFLNGESDV
jgi:hypothetical protein